MIDVAAIKLRYQTLSPVLDERARRRFAASEALAAGRGGIAAVSEATGIARSTIGRGLDELRGKTSDTAQGGIRRAGAGRKPLTETDPTLLADLEKIVDPCTRGDPLSQTRRRAWPRHHGAAPAARHQQVKQDRASALLVHLAQLARKNSGRLPDHRRADRRNHLDDRPDRPLRTRSKALSCRHQNHRRRDEHAEYQPRRLPR